MLRSLFTLLILLLVAADAAATINVISDQIVDGNGNPYQKPGGGNVTLDDLGLGTVPLGPAQPVRVVPWSTLPGDIGQMQHRVDKLYFSTVQGQIYEYDQNGVRNPNVFLNVDVARPAFNTGGPTSGQGLRGFAFHPDFDNAAAAGYRKLYTTHREDTAAGTATFDTGSGGSAIAHYALAEWDFNNIVGGHPAYRSLMRVAYPATDHVISQINFNPTAGPGDPDRGNLYIAFGDGGGSGSPSNTFHDMFGYGHSLQGSPSVPIGQNLQAIQASLIRINPLGNNSANGQYGIPADNPYVGADPQNALDEIYAKGFRNPTSMLFDQQTGALYSGDISQNTIEEINLIEKGHNYGWGRVEGTWLHLNMNNTSATMRYIPLGDGSDVTAISATYTGTAGINNATPVTFTNINRLNDGITSPIAQFSHERNQLDAANQSAAITGTVYRGTLAPGLEGLFLYSSLSQDELYYVHEEELVNDESPGITRELRTLNEDGLPMRLWQIVGAPAATHRVNHRFGQDANGEIYIISKHNDTIYRLEGIALPSIIGDTDIDGDVDQDDVDDFVAGWLKSAPAGEESWRLGDFDLDGKNSLPDIYLMHQALGNLGIGSLSPLADLTGVPEPATSLLAACGLAALVGWRQSLVCHCLQRTEPH